MKKTRYIPYGYTVRNGMTVVERREADIVKEIFDQYISGASLKDIAESLTARRVPYTEKTSEWDKARISRIIDNHKYIGNADYEPIIEEETYEVAVNTKSARKRNTDTIACNGVRHIRNKIRCAECGSMMIYRRYESCKVKDTWICTNKECGCKVHIADSVLVEKIMLILNRIIRNVNLLEPREKIKRQDECPSVRQLDNMLRQELQHQPPSEDTVLTLIRNIASEKYAHYDAQEEIALRLAKQRIRRHQPSDEFNGSVFDDITETVIIDEHGNVAIQTKTEAHITEE